MCPPLCRLLAALLILNPFWSGAHSATLAHSLTLLPLVYHSSERSVFPETAQQALVPTQTTLKATPSPSVLTETVSLEATVTKSLDGLSPTGVLDFYSDGTLIGSGNISSDNWFRLDAPTLPPGTHVLTTSYSGDSNFAASTSDSLTHIVLTSGVRLWLGYGEYMKATFYFAVVPPTGETVTDGIVSVTDGISSCSADVSAGSCSILFPTIGLHEVTATYSGTTVLDSTTSAPFEYRAHGLPVEIKTTVTPSYIDPGQTITITAIPVPAVLDPNMPRWPNGVTTIQANDTVCIANTCAFTLNETVFVTITYSGDTYFAAASRGVFAIVRKPTALSLDVTPNLMRVGESIIITAHINGGTPCDGYVCHLPSRIDYYDNGMYIGSPYWHPRWGFILPFVTTLTTPGTHSITGYYYGNEYNLSSSSLPITVESIVTIYLPDVRQER